MSRRNSKFFDLKKSRGRVVTQGGTGIRPGAKGGAGKLENVITQLDGKPVSDAATCSCRSQKQPGTTITWTSFAEARNETVPSRSEAMARRAVKKSPRAPEHGKPRWGLVWRT